MGGCIGRSSGGNGTFRDSDRAGDGDSGASPAEDGPGVPVTSMNWRSGCGTADGMKPGFWLRWLPIRNKQPPNWSITGTEEFDAWDICDQCCQNLFRLTPFAYDKVMSMLCERRSLCGRTAFALMATLAVGDKAAEDERFLSFFGLIEQASGDSRNFVRKAVNWRFARSGSETSGCTARLLR